MEGFGGRGGGLGLQTLGKDISWLNPGSHNLIKTFRVQVLNNSLSPSTYSLGRLDR